MEEERKHIKRRDEERAYQVKIKLEEQERTHPSKNTQGDSKTLKTLTEYNSKGFCVSAFKEGILRLKACHLKRTRLNFEFRVEIIAHIWYNVIKYEEEVRFSRGVS